MSLAAPWMATALPLSSAWHMTVSSLSIDMPSSPYGGAGTTGAAPHRHTIHGCVYGLANKTHLGSKKGLFRVFRGSTAVRHFACLHANTHRRGRDKPAPYLIRGGNPGRIRHSGGPRIGVRGRRRNPTPYTSSAYGSPHWIPASAGMTNSSFCQREHRNPFTHAHSGRTEKRKTLHRYSNEGPHHPVPGRQSSASPKKPLREKEKREITQTLDPVDCSTPATPGHRVIFVKRWCQGKNGC